MIKNYLAIAFCSITSMMSFAQNNAPSTSNVNVYDNWKKTQITKHAVINTNNSVNKSIITHQASAADSSLFVNTASCGCLQSIDTSYHYVPFTMLNGSPSGTTGPYYLNDDGSTALINLPFDFIFYEDTIHSLYINNNGNVSFSSSYSSFSSVSFPTTAFNMIAPFWGDVDTRGAIYDTINGALVPHGRVMYKITPSAIIIKWENVGYFNSQQDKQNTFQLILTNGIDALVPAGNNVSFCYGDMQWTTGGASQGQNGFGGIAATIGINKGDGINYFQITQVDHDSDDFDGGYGATDGVNFLDNKTFFFNTNTGSGLNVPPISMNDYCDSIYFDPGDSIQLVEFVFAGPESGDFLNLQLAANPNATVISNTPGQLARMIVQITAPAATSTNNQLVVTATDNFTSVNTEVVPISSVVPVPVITSVKSNKVNETFIVSPNPTNGQLLISFAKAGSLSITNLLGETIVHENVTANTQFKTDISAYSKGVYFVKLQTSNQTIIKKVIKE